MSWFRTALRTLSRYCLIFLICLNDHRLNEAKREAVIVWTTEVKSSLFLLLLTLKTVKNGGGVSNMSSMDAGRMWSTSSVVLTEGTMMKLSRQQTAGDVIPCVTIRSIADLTRHHHVTIWLAAAAAAHWLLIVRCRPVGLTGGQIVYSPIGNTLAVS